LSCLPPPFFSPRPIPARDASAVPDRQGQLERAKSFAVSDPVVALAVVSICFLPPVPELCFLMSWWWRQGAGGGASSSQVQAA